MGIDGVKEYYKSGGVLWCVMMWCDRIMFKMIL
jgi:hypothetical protein